ncbi:SDR family NAD(P)-dependent oxidoreductase [Parafrankia discariae]|uniref:SDR family NAD(P)-dependent oxidoreductase n=1 Tax=Parafrankia discariae TaxID=365528 RepID=UPI00036E19EA|nr:SDR family oxidoreductase [Parafrankia discariae]
MELTGKVAIVTGGAGNLGSACARRLALEGAAVVVADRPGTAVAEIVEKINADGGRATGCFADVSREPDVQEMIALAVRDHGRLDVLANAAAIIGDSDRILDGMDVELWDRVMAVNVRGSMLGCKHAIPAMLVNGGGSIINFTSSAAFHGDVVRIAYSSSKAALVGLTRAVATAYGRRGIRSNAISPHVVWSDEIKGRLDADWIDIAERTLLTPRAGVPDDIAHMVVYLASDKSTYITGQTISVDGGGTAHQPWVGVR